MIWLKIDYYSAGEATWGNLHTESTNSPKPGGRSGWVLKDPIHLWLMDRTHTYEIEWSTIEHSYWHIGIEDKKIAMLFKLIWL